MNYIKVSNIKLNIDASNDDAINTALDKISLSANDINDAEIVKLSIDARKKPNIKKIFTVGISTDKNILKKDNITVLEEKPKYKYKITGTKKLNHRPIVVGFGPAGMFVSYLLAINGYKPIIIERGGSVDERIESVKNFWDNNELDTESNVQFGEGGAGTFSDGKLNTGNKDKQNRIKYVLETLVNFGANDEIKYDFKPHIGSDVLTTIVKNIRNDIIAHGGEFHFNTKVIDITNENTLKLETDNQNFESNVVILAIGNAARDTFQMLINQGFELEPKPFAIGLRIEHKQKDINFNQYGFEDNRLGAAPYKLTYHSKSDRSIYSFCMCPGGYVVNSSSEKGKLVVNGMSYSGRDGENANSAIVCSVTSEDYLDSHPLSAIAFQRTVEELAFEEGEGKIPVQKYIDFKNNVKTTELGKIKPNMKGEYKLANLRNVLPPNICEDIIEGIEHFGNIINGFNDDDVVLSGVESRTSSPVRIIRDVNLESNIKGVYPIGEGAGYAGGIVSSAVDGIKLFEKIIAEFKPF
ncbi:MAG: FAD-dependent oxidoreductase [Eubacterium sp.]|nr:FAD-dependent oxidoreductase [Eubacterium sp.]